MLVHSILTVSTASTAGVSLTLLQLAAAALCYHVAVSMDKSCHPAPSGHDMQPLAIVQLCDVLAPAEVSEALDTCAVSAMLCY